jgi:hypothetical protein
MNGPTFARGNRSGQRLTALVHKTARRLTTLSRTRVLAVLIPAALVVAAFLPATAGAYTRGFQVYNLSSHPIKFDKLDLAGGATFDSAPPLGAVLLQGEAHDFEETYWFLTITNGTARYQILGDDGQSIGTFKASMAITAGGKVWSSCETTLGTCTPTPGGYDMHKLTLMDPESTVHEIPARQGEAQARVLNKLCQANSSATCTFTPTDVISVNSPIHPVGNALINNSDEEQTINVTISDTVGSTDSVELAVKAEASS